MSQTDPEDPYSEDVMLIKVACGREDFTQLKPQVIEAIKRGQEVSPKVEWVPPDHYVDTLKSYKFKRFKDLRKRQVK